jgi:DUF4097 and DUF4098 domain-containing protein YvlB
MKNAVPLLMVAALAVVLALPGAAKDKQFDKTFTVSAGGTLHLETDAGSVKITGGSGSDVVVKVEIRGSDSFVKDFEVSARQEGRDVYVKGEVPQSFWRMFSSGNQDARFTVTVPAKYNIDASTAGGDVLITAIEGHVKGQTSGGDIGATEVVGDVSVGTSGGDVEVKKVQGMVDASTSGGDVVVSSVKGDVKAETSGGNVKVDGVEGAVNAGTSGGNVHIAVRGGNKGIRAETSGGNVEVSIASNVSANLDAATSGGDVECDLPVTVQGKISESSIKGTVNGGGPLIYAHTSGGNVRIKSASGGPK